MALIFKKYSKTAFSLIESSMVLATAAVLLTAGTIGGKHIIKKAKQSSARSLAKSSPIPLIPDVVASLETSLEESLDNSETLDGKSVTTWKDTSRRTSSVVTFGSVKPTYSDNGINNIPAISFPGNTNSYASIDASPLNGSDYTIVVTEERTSSKDKNCILGDPDYSGSDGGNLGLCYMSNGTVIHTQNSTTAEENSSAYASSAPDYVAGTPRTFVITSDANGKKTYVNGQLVSSSTDTSKLSGLSNLYIGKNYDGKIGEVAIYNRALKNSEIGEISNYQRKKLDTKSPIIAGSTIPSCDGGTVDNGGNCLLGCTISITGSSTTSVYNGSGTVTCDSDGYSGTATYSCDNGTASNLGTCSSSATCTATSGTGYGAQSGLVYAEALSGTFSCDATGYTGDINYTCITEGEVSATSGSCSAITCTANADTGYNSQSNLAYTPSASTFNCDASGYIGTVNYTCTSVGSATINNNDCTPAHCFQSGVWQAHADTSPPTRDSGKIQYTKCESVTDCTTCNNPTIKYGSAEPDIPAIPYYLGSLGSLCSLLGFEGGYVSHTTGARCGSDSHCYAIVWYESGGIDDSNYPHFITLNNKLWYNGVESYSNPDGHNQGYDITYGDSSMVTSFTCGN